jgi:hypothetical protein
MFIKPSNLNFQSTAGRGLLLALASALIAGTVIVMNVEGSDSVPNKEKRIIGATAMVSELSSGLRFPARVDTGAETCSLHVERIEIEDKTPRRVHNIGKAIRIKLKGNDGKSHWIEGIVADAVRVKSSSLPEGEYDHRYKVRLTLEWKDVRKEVLVTLNDRTDMEYPLLLGRNFLNGDFLVDVSQDTGEG